MATITTDTYLDGGTARTAGETWAINGCTLTIRTDTRWHANSPASMTGVLGAVTMSSTLGGGLFVDATNVRWMAFDTGSGTVPAINTSITQGGVTGTLLGVWVDLTTAPTAVGASMPSSGFLKFREITGGTFSSGALTGITANASSPDVVGWMEVVFQQSTTMSVASGGLGFKTRGSKFSLGTTTGSAGQTFQLPLNGGGSTTPIQGVEIETSPGSGVYDWYPCMVANGTTGGWIATAIATDVRGKAVQWLSGGQVRIGSDGTTNMGYVPVSGCNVRCNNIFLRQAASATRATNAQPGASTSARPAFTFTNGGTVDLQNTSMDWYLQTAGATNVTLTGVAYDYYLNLTSTTKSVTVNGLWNGQQTSQTSQALNIAYVPSGTISNVKIVVVAPATNITFTYCSNLAVSNMLVLNVSVLASSFISWSQDHVSNSTFTNCSSICGYSSLSSCSYVTVTNYDYCAQSGSTTFSTSGAQPFSLSSTDHFTLDGLTVGVNGAVSNNWPYNGLADCSSCNNIKVRNIGTFSSPLNVGASGTNYPGYVLSLGTSPNTNISVQRVYLTGIRTNLVGSTTPRPISVLMEHVYGTTTVAQNISTSNSIFRNIGAASTMATQNLIIGSNFIDYFTSNTVGVVGIAMNDSGSSNASDVTLSGGAAFTGNNQVALVTSGSYVIVECPWFIIGHTAFANSAPTLTGTTTNMSFQYDLDTGSGFSGSYKTMNATNLSGETISASTGFKLRIKVTATSTSTSNLLTSIKIATVSTSTAQSTNLYPLDTYNFGISGLVAGSVVNVYTGSIGSSSVLIGNTSSSGTSFSMTHSVPGTSGYFTVTSLGYQDILVPYTFAASDFTYPITQAVDRVYVNP